MATCRECGHDDWVEKVLDQFETSAFGIRAVIRDTIIEKRCNHCGETKYTLPRDGKIEAALAMARCLIPVKLSGSEIRFIRKTLGMTGKEFASKIAGGDASTLSRWEHDAQGVGAYADMVIRQKAATLLHDRTPAIPYEPKVFIGMELIQLDEMPPITLVPVKVVSGDHLADEWFAKKAA